MIDILIREASESDLLTIRKLTLELIEAMGNPLILYSICFNFSNITYESVAKRS